MDGLLFFVVQELELDWSCSWTGAGLDWGLCSRGHCGGLEVPVGRRSSPTVAAPRFHFTSVEWIVGVLLE